MTPAEGALLVAAGVAAGVINTIAGGGSLVGFPALLAVGYSPVLANVTNAVAVLPGYLTGAITYRPELEGQRHRVAALAPAAALGGLGGAVLLIETPASTFEFLAPFLILLACVLLAAQPRLEPLLAERGSAGGRLGALHLGIFASAVYGGYFGAGLGVLILGVSGLLIGDHLQRLNAMKNVISLIVGTVAVLTFVFIAPIAWGAAGLMAAGSLVGGYLGVTIARRLPAPVLRWGIVCFGVAVAIVLLAT